MSSLLRSITSEALMCRLPSTLLKPAEVDLQKCRLQFSTLVTTLRDLGVDVVELPPDENSPSCCNVGDVAFVLNGMGVVMKPKGRLENDVQTVRTLLKKELEIPLVEIEDENAFVEGADILFTGRELFIGLSQYTNECGAAFIARTFPEYPCSPIKLPGPHHLSHYVAMVAEDVICVGNDGGEVIKRMEREASFRSYQTLSIPRSTSSLLLVNGTLIHSSPFLQTLPRQKPVELSELEKLTNFGLKRLVVLLSKEKVAKKK